LHEQRGERNFLQDLGGTMKTITRHLNSIFGVMITAVVITLMVGSAQAATFTVTNTNNSGVGSLRSTIVSANFTPGADTIDFDPVVFATPQTIVLSTGQMTISDDLTINGPGAGLLTIDANFASRVFYVHAATVTMGGLKITHGDASNEVDHEDAGNGIANTGVLTLNGCIVSNNSGGSIGGGVYNEDAGTLFVNNSSVSNNTTQHFGGGIYNGGLANIANSTIGFNTAGLGGGIHTRGEDFNEGDMYISGSTIRDNIANGAGGGIYVNFASVDIRNSTISGNSAEGKGGGVMVGSLTGFKAVNTTIAFNRANSDDVDENFDEGGGISTYSNPDATVLNNSIIVGNVQGLVSPIPSDIHAATGGSYGSNNIVGSSFPYNGGMSNGSLDNIVGVNALDVIEGFLVDNGGPTVTHKLVADSIAINSGWNAGAVDENGDPLLYDQRGLGFPRFVGTIVDRGAYEFEQVLQPTSTVMTAPSATQYSDVVTLSSTTTANGSAVTSGSVEFFVNGNLVGTDAVDANGLAIFNTQILLPAGNYAVSAVYAENASYGGSAGSSSLTVTKEDATITHSAGNPESVKANVPGGTAGPITLCANISDAADGSLGDISKAVPVTFVLSPVAPGATLQVSDAVLSAGTACVTFNSVPVNVYDVAISVGGNYYTGSDATVLAVYDPSLGFTTGGGRAVNPTTGNTLHFGFSFKYDKKSLKGQMLVMEHKPDGTVVKLKSNSLSSLSIVGSQAMVIGKASIMNGSGNLSFRLNVTDNGEPGTSDKFGLKLTMTNGSIIPAFTIDPPRTIIGGNIQVPQASD
jgi:hypothetical protein